MGNRRNGFTLVELLTAIVVMTIISGAAMMSLTAADQTAKREAERVQAYIYDLMRKADRAHVDFEINATESYIWVRWNYDTNNEDFSFIPTEGCYYSDNFNGNKTYNHQKKLFPSGGSISVYGADGGQYDVVLATATEGRISIKKIK
ncbi:MAG: type II secretion system protein [Synergistaceae bacterium]|nr:type II secretion system protein [Synergistaceae bacterium]